MKTIITPNGREEIIRTSDEELEEFKNPKPYTD